MRAITAPASTVGVATPSTGWVSVALPRTADACYDLFCQVERIPEWLAVVRSAFVTRRDVRGRATEVSFMARLTNATIGYTCRYRYHAADRRIAWTTAPESSLLVKGFASFAPLGPKACMMTYALDLDLGDLPTWSDTFFQGHAASATLGDFRDFVTRAL